MPHDLLSHVATSFSRIGRHHQATIQQTTFSIRGRPNSSTPALSSYSMCLNERTKTSTLPSQITGKYELDFPDSSSKRQYITKQTSCTFYKRINPIS